MPPSRCPGTLPHSSRIPEFFRVFILQHNLSRFGTEVCYHHQQPFWYYGPVMLLGLLPWTAFILAAMVEAVRRWWAARGTGVENAEQSKESLSLFCLIWLVIPILFFSVSQSKLPGYILPALQAGIILLSEYMRRRVSDD